MEKKTKQEVRANLTAIEHSGGHAPLAPPSLQTPLLAVFLPLSLSACVSRCVCACVCVCVEGLSIPRW